MKKVIFSFSVGVILLAGLVLADDKEDFQKARAEQLMLHGMNEEDLRDKLSALEDGETTQKFTGGVMRIAKIGTDYRVQISGFAPQTSKALEVINFDKIDYTKVKGATLQQKYNIAQQSLRDMAYKRYLTIIIQLNFLIHNRDWESLLLEQELRKTAETIRSNYGDVLVE